MSPEKMAISISVFIKCRYWEFKNIIKNPKNTREVHIETVVPPQTVKSFFVFHAYTVRENTMHRLIKAAQRTIIGSKYGLY